MILTHFLLTTITILARNVRTAMYKRYINSTIIIIIIIIIIITC